MSQPVSQSQNIFVKAKTASIPCKFRPWIGLAVN